jgi:hypothetical protein
MEKQVEGVAQSVACGSAHSCGLAQQSQAEHHPYHTSLCEERPWSPLPQWGNCTACQKPQKVKTCLKERHKA